LDLFDPLESRRKKDIKKKNKLAIIEDLIEYPKNQYTAVQFLLTWISSHEPNISPGKTYYHQVVSLST